MKGFMWKGVSEQLQKRLGEDVFIIHNNKVFKGKIEGFDVRCMAGYYRTESFFIRARVAPHEVQGSLLERGIDAIYKTEDAANIDNKKRIEDEYNRTEKYIEELRSKLPQR